MLNEHESNLLITLKRLGRRESIFPPTFDGLQEALPERDGKSLLSDLVSLQNKGYLRIAKGRARGVFINSEGLALADLIESGTVHPSTLHASA